MSPTPQTEPPTHQSGTTTSELVPEVRVSSRIAIRKSQRQDDEQEESEGPPKKRHRVEPKPSKSKKTPPPVQTEGSGEVRKARKTPKAKHSSPSKLSSNEIEAFRAALPQLSTINNIEENLAGLLREHFVQIEEGLHDALEKESQKLSAKIDSKLDSVRSPARSRASSFRSHISQTATPDPHRPSRTEPVNL